MLAKRMSPHVIVFLPLFTVYPATGFSNGILSWTVLSPDSMTYIAPEFVEAYTASDLFLVVVSFHEFSFLALFKSGIEYFD